MIGVVVIFLGLDEIDVVKFVFIKGFVLFFIVFEELIGNVNLEVFEIVWLLLIFFEIVEVIVFVCFVLIFWLIIVLLFKIVMIFVMI